jgi:hypothetical protein
MLGHAMAMLLCFSKRVIVITFGSSAMFGLRQHILRLCSGILWPFWAMLGPFFRAFQNVYLSSVLALELCLDDARKSWDSAKACWDRSGSHSNYARKILKKL